MAFEIPGVVVDSLVAVQYTAPHVSVQRHFATEDLQVSRCLQSRPQHNEPRYPSWAAGQAQPPVSPAAGAIHARHESLKLTQSS